MGTQGGWEQMMNGGPTRRWGLDDGGNAEVCAEGWCISGGVKRTCFIICVNDYGLINVLSYEDCGLSK